eukprot:scaffold2799_cov66-Phaeocystis_antarctica.AAC.1
MAGCGGAACCRMGSAVFVRPCALAFRARRCGCRCRAARCWPPAMSVRLKATVGIVPSITQSTTHSQATSERGGEGGEGGKGGSEGGKGGGDGGDEEQYSQLR